MRKKTNITLKQEDIDYCRSNAINMSRLLEKSINEVRKKLK